MQQKREIHEIPQMELQAIGFDKSELEKSVQHDLRMIRQELARRAAENGESGVPTVEEEAKQKSKTK